MTKINYWYKKYEWEVGIERKRPVKLVLERTGADSVAVSFDINGERTLLDADDLLKALCKVKKYIAAVEVRDSSVLEGFEP